MSEKNKENSVVFSNKELKDVANTPSPPQPRPKKRASFIDDASSILSDIKTAISDDVAEEMGRFEEERRSAAEAILQREEALKEAQRAEIQARRAAEEARQQAAAEERAAMLDRLQQPAGPSTNEITESAVAADHSALFSDATPPKKSKVPIVAGAVVLLIFGAGFYAVNSGLDDKGVAGKSDAPLSTSSGTSETAPPKADEKKAATVPPAPPVTSSQVADAGIDDKASGDKGDAKPAEVKPKAATKKAGIVKKRKRKARRPRKKATRQSRAVQRAAVKKAKPKKKKKKKKKKRKSRFKDDVD